MYTPIRVSLGRRLLTTREPINKNVYASKLFCRPAAKQIKRWNNPNGLSTFSASE